MVSPIITTHESRQLGLARAMASQLLPGHWVRRLANTSPFLASDEEVERLLKRVCDLPDTSRGAVTAILLVGLAPLSHQQRSRALQACLKRVNAGVSANLEMAVVRWVTVTGGLVWPILMAMIFSLDHREETILGEPGMVIGVSFVLSIVIMVLALPLCALYEAYRSYRARTAAAWTLGRLGSSLAVSPLLRAATSPEPGLRWASEESLIELLSAAGPDSEIELAPDAQRACCSLLKSTRESLLLAVLGLLKQCGNGEAIPPVAALLKTTTSDRVKQSTFAVLAALEARRRQAQNAGSLLRASMPDCPPETLLRPHTSSSTQEEELLRSVGPAGQ